MVELTSATAPARAWRLVTLAGGASFAVSYGLLHYVFPIGSWVGSTSAPLTSLVLCAIIAFFAMALTLAVLARMLRTDNQRMRVAINNMSQGLCMFDGNERLVVCNQRYMDMYKVSGNVVKPGITLQNLLKYRISNGSFTGDPVEYRRDLVGDMSADKTTSTEVQSENGRSITVINRSMRDGGWVATHEDVTERRDAERERVSMQEQQQRRAMIDQAIAAFRRQVEDDLKTVAEGAKALRSTASTLFSNSGQTSNSADGAVSASNA